MAIIYLAAEPIARSIFPDRLKSIDLILNGVVFDKQITRSIFKGFAVGLILLGMASFLLFLTEIFHFPLVLHVHDFDKILTVNPPILALLRGLLWRVPLFVMVFFFFVPSFLATRGIKPIGILLLSGLIFNGALSPLVNFHPFIIQFLFAVLTGAILTWLFISEGLLATNIAIGVVFLSLRLPPLIRSSAPEFFVSGLVGVFILALPLFISFISFIWSPKKKTITDYTPVYLERLSAQAKANREMEIARNIQLSLQPKNIQPIKSFSFSSLFIPSEEVAGDAYDFIPLKDGKYAVMMLDVSGHGVAAALLTSHIHAQVRILLKYQNEPDKILAEINDYLYRETPKYMFATLFLIIEDEDGQFVYSSAGHNAALQLK